MARRSAIERAVESLSGQSGERRVPAPRQRASRRNHRKLVSARHKRKCNVCRHTDRKAIEHDFLNWRSADQIAEDYGIADHSSVYRHAHAMGLFDRRANTIRLALSPIVERAMTVEVTADSVIRAVELLARLNGNGQLINPPKHVIHHSSRPVSSPAEVPKHRSPSLQPTEPNRQNVRVEHHANH